MAKPVVLVVEDDDAIRRGLVDTLRFGGFATLDCGDGERARDLAVSAEIDLILLDVVLPGVDGLTILGEVRKRRPTLPVILITARGSEDDRVLGLKGGADDYVVKPFSAREVLARVEAVMRRSPSRVEPCEEIHVAGRSIHVGRREVTWANGERRQLSEKELEIVRYLASAPGRPVSRDELLHRVWGLNPRGLSTRTVDMHVARLREKLGDSAGADSAVIRTIRGKGYVLAEDAEVEA
ncbi:MAG: response regulator transcription factor [Planctomycetes bacterium]|nr:response regulator transcription factor [Planctomycetota bacterium]